MNVAIRELEQKDIELLRELNREVFIADKDNIPNLKLEWPDSSIGQKYYETVVNKNNGKIGFLTEAEGKPVGYIALSTRDLNFRTSSFVEVENIDVSPDYRSQGIGKKLLDRAEIWAKQQGANKLLVEAFAKNTREIDFYHNFGFTESAITFEKKLE